MAAQPGPVFYEDENFLIRPANTLDEDGVRRLWWGNMKHLQWNRGYDDLDTYMNPSNGFGLILLIEKATGHPIGHVSAIINDNSTGWVSMFIIDEKYQGKGLGRELFKACERDLAEKNVQIQGLDGVVQQKGTYERRGFVASPLGTVQIWTRQLVVKDEVPQVTSPANIQIVDIRKVPRALLAQHELKYTGFDRPKLWSDQHMFSRPDVEGVAIVSKADPERVEDIKAWVVNRPCHHGVRIGPVYADSPENARAVLVAAMDRATPSAIKRGSKMMDMSGYSSEKIASEGSLVAEVWGGNEEAVKLFGDLGWKPFGVEYYRMWKDGKAPQEQSSGGLAQKGVYAIFDAAVG